MLPRSLVFGVKCPSDENSHHQRRVSACCPPIATLQPYHNMLTTRWACVPCACRQLIRRTTRALCFTPRRLNRHSFQWNTTSIRQAQRKAILLVRGERTSEVNEQTMLEDRGTGRVRHSSANAITSANESKKPHGGMHLLNRIL